MLLALVQQLFRGREIREFPLTTLRGAAGERYVSGLVEVCALLAPNKGLRF